MFFTWYHYSILGFSFSQRVLDFTLVDAAVVGLEGPVKNKFLSTHMHPFGQSSSFPADNQRNMSF